MLISFEDVVKKYQLDITGIIHIGAHMCEELKVYQTHTNLTNKEIIWIEANPKLVRENLKQDNTIMIKNFICCDTDIGCSKLNISNNFQSSSILELGKHKDYYTEVKYIDTVEVKNKRIDTMYKEENIPNDFADFANIDIQGAELLALKGMGNLLNHFVCVYVEVNDDYVYKDCALVHEIDEYLKEYNFMRVETIWTDANWGDAVYLKNDHPYSVKFNQKLQKFPGLKTYNNMRFSEEYWTEPKFTLEQAIEKSVYDPRVKGIHWYNGNGGDGKDTGKKGWYQGAGGKLIKHSGWDTLVLDWEEKPFSRIDNELFYCKTDIVYPPFKNGLYLEEYFLEYLEKSKINTKRKYIPAYWTNIQNNSQFKNLKSKLQKDLNRWVKQNPSSNGYFTIVQYADSVLLKLPKNTIVYCGGNYGDHPLPLIYEDTNHTLERFLKKDFREKKYLCSFVGCLTCNNLPPDVRRIMFDKFHKNPKFNIVDVGGWTNVISEEKQKLFVDITSDSKFSLAPRGYGRSSFRFFECFQLGSIPIYIWNDKEWLPFKNIIDYKKLCFSIHISEIDSLEEKLINTTQEKYTAMWDYYNSVKHLFTLEGMSKQILNEIGTQPKISLCIPTMNRYKNFLEINLPKYIKNDLISEIVISDENGNDIKQIKENIKDLSKFKFHVNNEQKGVFYNKIQACKLATNEWIALIDSDNFAPTEYFSTAIKIIETFNFSKKNVVLAPSFAKPHFDYRRFNGMCFKKDKLSKIPNAREKSQTVMNTMNYILNKSLIDNLFISDEDASLLKNKNMPVDSILLNILFFEQQDMEMYIVENMHYEHAVHDDSNYLREVKQNKNIIDKVHKRYYDLFN